MLKNLTVFFSKQADETHLIHIPKPDFTIFKAPKEKRYSQEEKDTFNKYAALLEVDNIVVPDSRPMEIE